MSKFGWSVVVVIGLLLASPHVDANAPAPWWACEGKAENDSCEPYGADEGVCVLETECSDDDSTEVNECLRCWSTSGGDESLGCHAAGPSTLLLVPLLWAYRRFRRRA